MAKYNRFEELPVWQTAIDLGVEVFELVDDAAFVREGDLCSQLRRAALSASNNIAEGFERGTKAELLTFLYFAKGSAGEVRSMLLFAERLRHQRGSSGRAPCAHSSSLDARLAGTHALAQSVCRQIAAWAAKLQDSSIQGQRHMNRATRADYDRRQRSAAFWEKLQRVTAGEKARDVFGPLDFDEPGADTGAL